MRRALVLGGKGFIGSHLVDALKLNGLLVRSFDRPDVKGVGDLYPTSRGIEHFEGDFGCEADVAKAVQDCDVVFHLVSTTLPKSSNLDPVFDVETNVVASLRMLSHAVRAGVKKVVFASSGGTVYGVPNTVPIKEEHPTEPICSYGIAKLAIEKYLHLYRQLHGLESVVLRLSNPYGERQRTHASQGAIAVFLGKALRGETIEIWGDGSVVRDYIHVSDVVRALLAAMDYNGPHHVFNVGSGRGFSLLEVVTAVESATGIKPVCSHLAARSFDVPINVLSIDRARRALDWNPAVGLQQGISLTAAWLAMTEEKDLWKA